MQLTNEENAIMRSTTIEKKQVFLKQSQANLSTLPPPINFVGYFKSETHAYRIVQ